MSLYTKTLLASTLFWIQNEPRDQLTFLEALGVMCGLLILITIITLWTYRDFKKLDRHDK